MKLHQRVKRAREEIERCHIAVRRLYTAIHDEEDDFKNFLSKPGNVDPLIYAAVHDFATRRQRVNRVLLARLKDLTDSPDYSGDCSRGVRAGRDASIGGAVSDVELVADPDHDDGDDEELGVDETDELVGQLVDYVGDLALLP